MKKDIIRKITKNILKSTDGTDKNESYNDYNSRKRFMKFNRFFSSYKVFTTFYFSATVIFFSVFIFLLNNMHKGSLKSTLFGLEATKSVSLIDTLFAYWPVLLLLLVIAVLGYFKFAYQVRVSFGSINVGQKGTARTATREEIDREYKKIPEKRIPFSGMGGVPIARDGDMIYIDDSNTNTLVIGMTRSGKDQIETDVFIENISRAEEKCSMIIGDPKLETAFKAIPELRKRGYDTYIFNLIDPEFSMQYNPLSIIIDEYKNGDQARAQELCLSLGTSILPPNPEEKDPYWTDMARLAFIAASWGFMTDAIAADQEENERRYAAHKKNEDERKKAYFKELYGEEYELYRKAVVAKAILNNDPEISDEELINDFNDICRYKGVALLLKKDEIQAVKTFTLKSASFVENKYYPVDRNEKKINIYNIIKMCNTLSSIPVGEKNDMLDHYFMNRPEDDFARITYGDMPSLPKQTKGTIMSKFKQSVQVFMLDNIAKMTSGSSIDIEDIFFGNKPVAIFYAVPDYDKSFHFLATVFISQLYFVAAKMATAMPGGKLPRRFHFWLNELCNIPKIDNLSNMSTVCLGRNIILHLLIQSYGQLRSVYGDDDAETLRGNCGNEIYLKAANYDSAKEVSEKLGTETQIVVNRTGKKLSINKELTEMGEERPIMTPYELMHMELGETIVMRTMKRQDNNGELIKGHTIKNFGEFRMKLSHEFLYDIFPQNQMLYKSPHIERIIEANPIYSELQLNIVDGGIHRNSDISMKKISANAEDYVSYYAWRKERFKAGYNLSISETKRMNEVFNLLNLSAEQRQLYMIAGTIDEEGEVIMPDKILFNGQIEDHAKKLIQYRNEEIRNAGYKLLEILKPLPTKEKSEDERYHEEEIEAFISRLGGDFQ